MVVKASVNVFSAGQQIWIGIPSSASPPYLFTTRDSSGATLSKQYGTAFPSDNLVSLSLSPSIYHARQSYQLALETQVATSPGLSVSQTSSAIVGIVPSFARLASEGFTRQNGMTRAQVALLDGNKNPSVGVHIGLTLLQRGASLRITTETTDSNGKAVFQVGEALAAGQYQYEVNVIDDGVFAPPIQLSQFTIGAKPTTLTTWASNGNIAAALLDSNQTPVPGRLLVLEGQLKDGNWTIISTTYTDDNGRASFTTPASTWRVSFGGDTFYSPSSSNTLTNPPNSLSPNMMIQTGTQLPTSLGNTLSNGHITLSIAPDTITIYDSQGQTILGHMGWEVQIRSMNSWQSLPWDGTLSMKIDDLAGYHRITLQGTAGNGQVAITMQFLGRPQDPPFTPFRTPVEIQALGGSHSYRLLWNVETNLVASFQFEQRVGDQRMVIRGPITAGSVVDQSPSGENSMLALARDGRTVLFGFNWDKALQYYQGTTLGTNGSLASASVAFGTFTLSSGQRVIVPACPCPDGGGGGGGTYTTTTTLYLPSSAYATINTVLKAQVKDQFGTAVPYAPVNFYRDGSSLGSAVTNTTGFASLVWTPGVTGSHVINATFSGNCCDLASSTKQTLVINQTPTTAQILKPQSIAYSWDLYNYYLRNGLPIVVPVNILALASSGNGSPANIYMPSYSGNSTTAPKIAGYGWAGLNSTSAVTVTFNSTYTQTQNMNWTRNFYLPPCPNPSNCSTSPGTGHMYLTASLSPPSTLYSSSSTSLNIPYQNVNSISSGSALTQTATPPSHLYINVNATYPYISTQMQNLPVALAAYNAYLAFSLGAPLGSSLSGGYTIYTLPVPSDFARVCFDSACASPAGNVNVFLYNSNGQYCGVAAVTNNRGVASLDITGPTGCTWPYYYAAIYTSGNTLTLTELFQIEAVSNPSPFYTNFQGYNYATYAPHRTGRYLLHLYTFFLNSPYTILYPSTSYPDVQYPYLSCCDIILNVEKHPLQAQATFNPGTATILNNINATIRVTDVSNSKPLSNSVFSYTLTRNDPNPGTVLSGTLTTNVNGTTTLSLGLLGYGNYTLSVSRSATSTLNALSSSFSFTVYKALPTLILRNISGLASATNGMIKYVNPAGTSSTLSIVHSQSNPYEFYAVIGTSTDLFTPPQTGTATCSGSSSINCVSIGLDFSFCNSPPCFPGWPIIAGGRNAQWVNGQPNGISCVSGFTNCSQAATRLTGTSNICGTQFCYRFSVLIGTISYIRSFVLRISLLVADSSGTQGTFVGYAYVYDPDGSFLVNGSVMRHSDASTPVGNAVSFQFNATSSPNSITSVTMNILNQTSSTTKSICLIGGNFGCLQQSQTTNGAFLLYSPSTIVFTPGTYIVTVTFTCPGCATTNTLVLSLVLVIPQVSWIQNFFVGNTYSFEGSLVNNATGTLVIASGLSENVYVNGVLYASFQTDSMGNSGFTWTPTTSGQYTITVKFPRQNYYASSSINILVSVSKRSVILAAVGSPPSPSVGQAVTWSISAYDMINNSTVKSLPVSLYVDGTLTTTTPTNSQGQASFTNTFGSIGIHNVTFASAQNATYNAAKASSSVMAFLETSLTLQSGNAILGQQTTVTLTLRDANGNPMSNRTVQVQINGASYVTLTTNINGQAQFSWQPSSIGSYAVAATFSASGPSDSGYRPSSANINVIMIPQITINTTSSGSGTQSVSLPTAQGSSQPSTPPPSISISFPSPGTITITASFLGKTAQVSLNESSQFGWNCVATVNTFLGSFCALSVPFEKIHIGAAISSILSFAIDSQVLGSVNFNYQIIDSPVINPEAENVGVLASIVDAGIGIGTFALTLEPHLAALAVQLATIVATAAGTAFLASGGKNAYHNFLLGLLAPALVGIACVLSAYTVCPPEIPQVPYVSEFLAAVGAWAGFESVALVTPLFVGDVGPVMLVALGFLIPAALLTLLN
jgi:5-hydroxyisourate hydrolase-like protein (transthyretin family)